MRLREIPVLLALTVGSVAAQASEPSDALSAWAEAYAARDGDRSAALYTEEASVWGTASRTPARGREAIAAYFAAREGIASTSVTFDDQEVRPLGDGAALAYGRYTFRQRRTDGTETALPARFSMVLTRGTDGVWRISHHHSSPMPAQR